jgi:hypothetical protein
MEVGFSATLLEVPTLLVLVGCIIYFSRTKSSEGLTALAGQFIVLTFSIASVCLRFMRAGENLTAEAYANYAPWVRVGGFIGAILFSLAFLKIVTSQPLHRQEDLPE